MADRDLERQLGDMADELKRLRDELRVRLHLAGLDVRDRWRELEPKLAQPEKLAHEVNETSRKRLAELRDRARELLERVRRESGESGDQPHA